MTVLRALGWLLLTIGLLVVCLLFQIALDRLAQWIAQ